MKIMLPLLLAIFFIFGCESKDKTTTSESQGITGGAKVVYNEPEPQEVPEPKTPSSDEDWEAKVHNKNIEIIQVFNIINAIYNFFILYIF